MNDGYWKSVPRECIEKWRSIFAKNEEGPDLSASCPVCQNKGLHRYYQAGKKIKRITSSDQYIARDTEWQWCSFCRSYEHAQVVVPDWWVPSVEIDGNKLTAVPEILDMAYQDAQKVNKWNHVPEQYLNLWDEIFDADQGEVVLQENCPICNEKMLCQYYTLSKPEQVNNPAASNGASSLQRCRAAGYVTLAAFAKYPCKHDYLAHCSRESNIRKSCTKGRELIGNGVHFVFIISLTIYPMSQ